MPLRAATRGSALALWQTEHVAELLRQACGRRTSPVIVSTEGDRRASTPISQMGGKGVFVKEVQQAVLDGRADYAVHSAKDLPAVTPEGLSLAAVPPRGDARDALVGCRLADLSDDATIGTGSARRRVQLMSLRPDLRFAELRGNIATRLRKARRFDAIVMAAVAIERLGVQHEVIDVLEPEVMVPQVGQGALAVECRSGDTETLEAVKQIEDTNSRLAVDAERAFLAELGGDCDLPAGAYCTISQNRELAMEGLLASHDARIVVRHSAVGDSSEQLGRNIARTLVAQLHLATQR